jgi:hypothetical protein
VSGNIARVAGFELFVSVSQQAFTTQTGFLVGTRQKNFIPPTGRVHSAADT